MSAGVRTEAIVLDLGNHLTPAEMAQVLLKAIPVRTLRTVQPAAPAEIPGLRVQPRAGSPVQDLFYDPEVSQHFQADPDALEYLEEMRSVLLAEDGARDAETLAFLRAEFAEYRAKQDVPGYYHLILSVFSLWDHRTHGTHITSAYYTSHLAKLTQRLALLNKV